MEQLNIILFAIGFVLSIIVLIAMLIKTTKGNKIGFLLPLVLIIGLVSLGSGVGMTIGQKKSSSNVIATNTNENNNTDTSNGTSALANSGAETKQTNDAAFDANGSVVPKKSIDMWGNETIIDADGSKSVGGILFTAQGIRYRISSEGAIVEIPTGKTSEDGKNYTQYTYLINNLNGDIWVTSANLAFKDENESDQVKDLGGGKVEKYPPNQGYEMKYIDFVYKYIPVSKPKNTVRNNFFSGNYGGKQENILEAKPTMSINILDDTLLDFKCIYMADMDSMYGYKIESLGKNAYKLYLYPAKVKADTNGGGVVIADEPLKRTFIVYMKSKDSFDIVFTSDDIKRVSINMNKQ